MISSYKDNLIHEIEIYYDFKARKQEQSNKRRYKKVARKTSLAITPFYDTSYFKVRYSQLCSTYFKKIYL